MAPSDCIMPEYGEEMGLRVCTCAQTRICIFDVRIRGFTRNSCVQDLEDVLSSMRTLVFAPPGYLHRSGVHVLVFAPTRDVH